MRRLLAERVVRSPGRKPRSAGRTCGVLPRYVAIGNARKVVKTNVLIPGRVYADYDIDGELIGIEVIG